MHGFGVHNVSMHDVGVRDGARIKYKLIGFMVYF